MGYDIGTVIAADCARCEEELLAPFKESDPIKYLTRFMRICSVCGSKRCPKAGDHRFDCEAV